MNKGIRELGSYSRNFTTENTERRREIWRNKRYSSLKGYLLTFPYFSSSLCDLCGKKIVIKYCHLLVTNGLKWGRGPILIHW